MTRETFYKSDRNHVELTGVIEKLDDYCKYVNAGPNGARALISFDLKTFRKGREGAEDLKFDENRIVVFDDETFHQRFQNGDRIRIWGELQSRNFTRDGYEVDELVRQAVKNYIDIFEEYPCEKPPKGKQRQPLRWALLLDKGLVPDVPEDSMFKADGTKVKEQNTYSYRIDEDGEVYKETQHVAYEVVAVKSEKLEEPFDPKKGDDNRVVLVGRITKQPYFDLLGQESKVAFCGFNVGTKSAFFEDRVFFNNVISWSKLAEDAFAKLQKDDYVKVVGRLQSRKYVKEFVRRWKSPSGKRKKKAVELELTTREISATKVEKCVVKKERPKQPPQA